MKIINRCELTEKEIYGGIYRDVKEHTKNKIGIASNKIENVDILYLAIALAAVIGNYGSIEIL